MPPDGLNNLAAWVQSVVREEVERILKERPPSDPGGFLSTTEAAAHARVTQGTIRRWVKEGRLEASSAGRNLLVRLADLQTILRSGQRVANRNKPKSQQTQSPEALAMEQLAKSDRKRKKALTEKCETGETKDPTNQETP